LAIPCMVRHRGGHCSRRRPFIAIDRAEPQRKCVSHLFLWPPILPRPVTRACAVHSNAAALVGPLDVEECFLLRLIPVDHRSSLSLNVASHLMLVCTGEALAHRPLEIGAALVPTSFGESMLWPRSARCRGCSHCIARSERWTVDSYSAGSFEA
jgi:hypothetical protein